MMRLMMIALLPLTLSACQSEWEKNGAHATASGAGATRSFDAKNFTGVLLRASDDVDVKVGPSFSVTAKGDPELLDQLQIDVVDGILRIGRKEGGSGFSWGGSDHGIELTVIMPRLNSASVTGSGDLNVERAEGDVTASIAGSGDLSISKLQANLAKFSVAGSGDLNVTGVATKLAATVAGSGDIDGEGLTANSAEVSVTGSGSVRAVVKGGAAVSLAGSGDITLTGGAKCAISKVGSGTVDCS